MERSFLTNERIVPVLYLDLDGTVRKGYDELGRFVNGPEDVRVFDGVPELLREYKNLGWRIIGISNQGGIALGHMSMSTCANAMIETQKQCGGVFDKVAWCMHHPKADKPEMAVCWCRKPRIGLIIESAYELAGHTGEIYPPHRALFVGDMDSDKECADNANVKFMWAADWRKGEHFRDILEGVH